MDIQVDGIPSTENALKLLAKFSDQIPFATALALTRTAERVGEAEVEQIKERFQIRREWFKRGTRYGVNINPANKKTLQARVFSRAPWLQLQETGGTKRPGSGQEMLTMPSASIRQSSDRLIPKRIQPSKVLANPKKYKAFRIGQDIWQRFGPEKKDIRVLFFGKGQARIPQRLGFKDTARTTVDRVYQKEFGEALAYAIATAKKS